jgi:hypothetical protein
MFESVISKATQPSKSSAQAARQEMPRTEAFLQALINFEHRLTYAALADAAAALGEHTPSGLSAGQRGSALAKKLPLELQPHVCRSLGGYAKGVTWECDVPGNLRNRAYVRPEQVLEFIQAFEENEAQADAEAVAQPEEQPVDIGPGEEIEPPAYDPETGEPLE